MEQKDLIQHLFRTEYRKICTVLCKHFGIEGIEMAEDIAGETFLLAMETWPYKGFPPNPTAWLYAVAKNKTINQLNRNKTFQDKIAGALKQSTTGTTDPEINWSDKNITDSQLKMLFVICHPSLSKESQIALSLRILCGFGIDEIANAFLTNKETINKRLLRAREKLRQEKVEIVFPIPKEISKRLDTVLMTLYLLFNEGYYSESHDKVLREELCLEAMRLTWMLIENGATNLPEVNALFALMCFHSSRFPARKNNQDEIILFADQDPSLWNAELIAKGSYHFNQSAEGNRLSKFHLEAAIAWWHTVKADTKEKWENILQLYNRLLQLEYSPVAALNRTYALSKANSKAEAIVEAEKLQLNGNQYYHTLLGELYMEINSEKSKLHLHKAFALAKTTADKKIISQKLDAMD